MPLPSSGQISISQIRTELGTSNGSLRALSNLAGFSTPDAMSEFYNYSAVTTNFISYYVPISMACGTNYTFAATSSSPVNTTLFIYINWFGDLGGFAQAYFTLPNGTSCNSYTIYSGVNCPSEFNSGVQYSFNCPDCTCCPQMFNGVTYGDPATLPTGGDLNYMYPGSPYPC